MQDQRYVPSIDMNINKSTIMESSDIKFLNLEEIKLLTNKQLYQFVRKIFKKSKSYI